MLWHHLLTVSDVQPRLVDVMELLRDLVVSEERVEVYLGFHVTQNLSHMNGKVDASCTSSRKSVVTVMSGLKTPVRVVQWPEQFRNDSSCRSAVNVKEQKAKQL